MDSKCVVCCEVHETSVNKRQFTSAEEQLTVVYFLENFLNYRVLPEGVVLVDSAESISFCKKCYRWVSQGRKLWLQLEKLEERLNSLRTQVEYKVWNTYSAEKKHSLSQEADTESSPSLKDSVRQSIFQKCADKGFEEPESQGAEDNDQNAKRPEVKIEALEIVPDLLSASQNGDIQAANTKIKSEAANTEIKSESGDTAKRTSRTTVKLEEECQQVAIQDVLGSDLNDSDNQSDADCTSDYEFGLLEPNKHRSSSSSSDSSYSEEEGESDYEFSQSKKAVKENKADGEKSSKRNRHSRRSVKSLERRTCPVCHKVLSRPSQMVAHLQAKHEKKLSYFCDICGKGFARKDTMKDHRLTHMNDEERTEFFASASSKRYVRMLNQTPRSMQQFTCVADKTCPECKKVFVTPSAMKNHLNSRHERKVMFHCDICQREFFRKDSLRIHERTHLTAEEKEQLILAKKINEVGEIIQNGQSGEEQSKSLGKYSEKIVNQVLARTCPVCKKIFDKPSRMQTHLEGVHTNRQTHICEVCGKAFAWRDTLVRHLKWHETGVKNRPFQCPEEGCGKAFATRRDLRVHSNTHTGKKDYLCQLCGAAFSQRFSYDRHLLYKHTENAEKKHKCSICDKSFLTKSLLAQHLKSKTHGGPGFKTRTSNSSSADPSNAKTKSVTSKQSGDGASGNTKPARKSRRSSGEAAHKTTSTKTMQTSSYCNPSANNSNSLNSTQLNSNYGTLGSNNTNSNSNMSLSSSNTGVQPSNHHVTTASSGGSAHPSPATNSTLPNHYSMMFSPYY